MKHLVIIVLLLATPFARADEESVKIAEQIVKPLLRWMYFAELPPRAVTPEGRRDLWPPAVRDRLLKSPVQTAWVSIVVPGATNTFTFDIGRRLLTPTDTTESAFLRAYAIGDGEAGLYQYLAVRIRAASEPQGFAVSFNTGSTCHGKYCSASFDKTGQVITLIGVNRATSKCCF
jgi:hypothetical protein